MIESPRIEIQACNASPNDLASDVKVFGERPSCIPFVVLELKAGGSTIRVFLPADSYDTARSIADLWPTLADRLIAVTPAVDTANCDRVRA